MRPRRCSLLALVAIFGLGGLGALGAGACSDDGASNPPVLWLDLDGSEIKVRLVEREPVPF